MIYIIDYLAENDINPVTNEKYNNSWIIIKLTHDPFKSVIASSEDGCAYTIRISKYASEEWFLSFGDAIEYCKSTNTNAIVVISESEFEEFKTLYINYKFDDNKLRINESTILVHSTSRERWDKICKDGMLKCWNRLKSEQVLTEDYPIGFENGDPEEFSNYIMFGGFDVSGEIVVSSRQCGYLNMDVNAQYITGARMYFDAKKMAEDGLLVRDGVHIKVRDILPLDKYLIWTATWEKIGLKNEVSTPRCFAEKSDKQFKETYLKGRGRDETNN